MNATFALHRCCDTSNAFHITLVCSLGNVVASDRTAAARVLALIPHVGSHAASWLRRKNAVTGAWTVLPRLFSPPVPFALLTARGEGREKLCWDCFHFQSRTSSSCTDFGKPKNVAASTLTSFASRNRCVSMSAAARSASTATACGPAPLTWEPFLSTHACPW